MSFKSSKKELEHVLLLFLLLISLSSLFLDIAIFIEQKVNECCCLWLIDVWQVMIIATTLMSYYDAMKVSQ